MRTRRAWTVDDVRRLGATTDLPTVAEILGIGRTLAYHLVATGRFPLPVIRAGARIVVPVAPLLRLLDDRLPAVAASADPGGVDPADDPAATVTVLPDGPPDPRRTPPGHQPRDAGQRLDRSRRASVDSVRPADYRQRQPANRRDDGGTR